MKSIHNKDGKMEITFDPHEMEFLLNISTKIPEALADASNKKLFPAYTTDASLDAELQEILHGELKAGRMERVTAFQAEIRACIQGEHTIRLNDAGVDRWLGVLNDLRLIVANELGIDSDDWGRNLTKEQATSRPVRIYGYLTHLQGALMEELGYENPS